MRECEEMAATKAAFEMELEQYQRQVQELQAQVVNICIA